MLTSLQFGPKAVRFLPASGLSGENLVSIEESNPVKVWYSGPTLLDAIDQFREPNRQVNKPFRAVITAVMKESKQVCDVSVKVLQGRISKGRGVGVGSTSSLARLDSSDTPTASSQIQQGSQFIADVRKICVDGVNCDILFAGQNGVLSLGDRSGLSGEEMCLREGIVLYKGPPPLMKCRKFKATIQTMSSLVLPIIKGSSFDLYLHGEEIQCHIKKIYSATFKKTEIKNPKCIPAGSTALIKIKMDREAYVELFSDCNALGRFALRTRGVTSAIGICSKVYSKKETTAVAGVDR
jgi:translation elongation factor EF-1alpha